ncbi:hypothetical protein ND748_07765 [Frankia sp. AiPs1]|uniref:hypothetical protein n=1 Tax=Frankia sp. AiPs1 TaxID=573493 RepID=UPI002044764D|nr:hypothetical protein [Frankia sp. AiPs1]MCM3921561.1 hypothetical protein [Frankia sp. AiPs1]
MTVPPPLSSFRLLHGTLIDLPFRPPPAATVRVATLWPESKGARGWAHLTWEVGPAGRGYLPALTDVGDVIGFIAEIRPPPRAIPANVWAPPTSREPPARPHYMTWYGYLHQVTATALLLRGPYPDVLAAYTGSQRAEIATLHHEHARTGQEPVLPAAPPLATSITPTGDTTTVGDPHHGWIRVSAHLLTAALTQPIDTLQRHLAARVPGLLTGREPAITIAALAARHLHDRLADPSSHPAPPLPPPGLPFAAPTPPVPPGGDETPVQQPPAAAPDAPGQEPGDLGRDVGAPDLNLDADAPDAAPPTAADSDPPWPDSPLLDLADPPPTGLDLP